MCFIKSKESKLLKAKRDIVVYKLGSIADKNTFIPYFIGSFKYSAGFKYQISPDFLKIDVITRGFHGYINIVLAFVPTTPISAAVQKNTKDRPLISTYPTIKETLYLGKFIIPKGATYCVNELNEIVSDQIIYTGQCSSIWGVFERNLKELWKEK